MQVLVLDACDGTFGHVGIMLPTRRHFWAPHFSSVSETNRKMGWYSPGKKQSRSLLLKGSCSLGPNAMMQFSIPSPTWRPTTDWPLGGERDPPTPAFAKPYSVRTKSSYSRRWRRCAYTFMTDIDEGTETEQLRKHLNDQSLQGKELRKTPTKSDEEQLWHSGTPNL